MSPVHIAVVTLLGEGGLVPCKPVIIVVYIALVIMQISTVVAVGLVEWMGQVNWRKVGHIVAWWLLGPFPLIAVACFIYWQGAPPAQSCTTLLLL